MTVGGWPLTGKVHIGDDYSLASVCLAMAEAPLRDDYKVTEDEVFAGIVLLAANGRVNVPDRVV